MRVIYLGSHGPSNGLQFLLEAAAYLRSVDRITLVLVGDGVEKPKLIAEAMERELDHIIFLQPVRREDVPGILKAADVALMIDLVVPGAEMAMPNKLFDYLAAGLPIVTNSPSELWDHLRDAQCGVLVDDHNPAQLVEALRQLRDEPGLRREMGHRALALAEKCFDRRKLNGQWEEVLLRAASKEEVRAI